MQATLQPAQQKNVSVPTYRKALLMRLRGTTATTGCSASMCCRGGGWGEKRVALAAAAAAAAAAAGDARGVGGNRAIRGVRVGILERGARGVTCDV